jgi:hypothetical protein
MASSHPHPHPHPPKHGLYPSAGGRVLIEVISNEKVLGTLDFLLFLEAIPSLAQAKNEVEEILFTFLEL